MNNESTPFNFDEIQFREYDNRREDLNGMLVFWATEVTISICKALFGLSSAHRAAYLGSLEGQSLSEIARCARMSKPTAQKRIAESKAVVSNALNKESTLTAFREDSLRDLETAVLAVAKPRVIHVLKIIGNDLTDDEILAFLLRLRGATFKQVGMAIHRTDKPAKNRAVSAFTKVRSAGRQWRHDQGNAA